MTSEPCTLAKRAHARVAALELLHREAVADVAQARAAVALQVAAEQTELGDLRDELVRERAVLPVLADRREASRASTNARTVSRMERSSGVKWRERSKKSGMAGPALAQGQAIGSASARDRRIDGAVAPDESAAA